jgi:putative transposase
MRTAYPRHLPAFSYVGLHRYSLTWCTESRLRLFVTSNVVDLVKRQILRAADDEGFALLAYCFMPDHLHLLIEAKSGASSCRTFMTRAKQFSGYHFGKVFGRRLWQRYGFEHVVRDDEMTLVVARYILENPLRAGLVRRVEDIRSWDRGSTDCRRSSRLCRHGPAEAGHYRFGSLVRLKPDATDSGRWSG